MQTFIEEVVASEKAFKGLEKAFIIPSRRAGVQLRKALADASTKTAFAPEIYSIEEFIIHISGLRPASNPEQLFILYESYLKSLPKENQESFKTFCGWGQTILADFNEIDRHLISQESIFNQLKDIKELTNHWSKETSSSLITNYLKFWSTLHLTYTYFCETLVSQGIAHQGLLYRSAVKNLESYLESNSNKRFVFIGFNALNDAEQQLIQGILAAGDSTIYWDVEKHFQTNQIHEVSSFTNTYQRTWPYFKREEFTSISNHYVTTKDIRTYACTSDLSQAKTITAIIKDLNHHDLNTTAIILGDESLLLPLLNSLPQNVGPLNITMGIPLSQTPAASFFDSLFLMKSNVTHQGYYYRDAIEMLSHPLTQKLIKNSAQTISKKIIKDNITFACSDKLLSLVTNPNDEPILRQLLRPWSCPRIAVQNCLELITLIRAELIQDKDKLQLEFIFGFHKVFSILLSLQEKNNYIEDVPTLLFFYRDVLSAETVHLRGDPQQGLQIMGVLESRVLDFENVIITSVNEGILPSGKSQNSFIPYDVKKTYGLPTYFEKDAIYSYHFYRLLYRSNTVSLLYTTESDGLGTVEKSRFIRQLEEDGIHTVQHINVAPPLHKRQKNIVVIEKSPEVLNHLKVLCRKGLSPSALTTYIRNPLKFYERYVLGVHDTDNVEEIVAANTLGTIVHNTLEELYTPLIGQVLNEEVLQLLLPTIEPTVLGQFDKEYGLDFISNGKNLIIYEVILRYIKNYITLEIDRINKGDEIIIQSLEHDLSDIHLKENYKLRGKVDLVEKRNTTTNIIDYKTGKVLQSDLRLTQWDDLLLPEGKYEKAFQVLMYAYMLHKKEPLDFPVRVGIISFKNLKEGFLPFRFEKEEQVTEETLQEFEKILLQLINEILDPSVPFSER